MLSKRKRLLLVLLALIILLAGVLLLTVPRRVLKRSIPGRIVRFIAGSPGVQQAVEDLAEDIRDDPRLANLRGWAEEVLARQRQGQLKTQNPPQNWPSDEPVLDDSEVDAGIRACWPKREGMMYPLFIVKLSPSGAPLFVACRWRNSGVIIGGPDYPKLDFDTFYDIEVQPGIWAYGT